MAILLLCPHRVILLLCLCSSHIGKTRIMNTEGSTSELNDVYSTIKLIDENNPMLHTKASEFDFGNPKYNPVRLYESVGSFMLKKNGLGLSANQVGFDARMFTLRATEVTDRKSTRL